jgi:hypothetical protein
MVRKKTIFVIRAKQNFGGRRDIKSFDSRSEARSFLNKLNAPGKVRKFGRKTIRLTSFRQGQSGTGINNPRISRRRVFR